MSVWRNQAGIRTEKATAKPAVKRSITMRKKAT
jgi:hypothetical protein